MLPKQRLNLKSLFYRSEGLRAKYRYLVPHLHCQRQTSKCYLCPVTTEQKAGSRIHTARYRSRLEGEKDLAPTRRAQEGWGVRETFANTARRMKVRYRSGTAPTEKPECTDRYCFLYPVGRKQV